MTTLFSSKRASSLALAVALATGSAVVATAIIPAEANAQRNRDRDRGQSENGGYSPEFVGAYQPLETVVNDETADLAAYRPQLFQLGGMLNTNDEKFAGGNLIFNAGIKLQDQTLQLLGMESMVASGMVPIEQTGRYNFIAYQLATALGDFPKARTYLQQAINYNFTSSGITAAGLQMSMAENYFSSEDYVTGLTYLQTGISRQKSSGQAVDEGWYRRGIFVAYNNNLEEQLFDIALKWVADYPTESSWRDTISMVRNLNDLEGQELLDLLRLGRKVEALQDSDYDYYVEAADARRLPKEVFDVIQQGQAAGEVSSDNLFLTESLETASGRIETDRAELPELERDAMAPDASVRLLAAAGDTFLSYGEYAKAATFYERALGMPEVNADEELTRLGIAQVGAEDYDAARETFAKISGNRAMIARLWVAYIDQEQVDDTPTLQSLFN